MKQNVYTLLSDNGDGGYTFRMFGTEHERNEWQEERAKQFRTEPLPEYWYEDEYEFGYRGNMEIDFTVKKKGVLLEKSCSSHFGQ